MLLSTWHTAYVTPVFKKDSTCQPEYYWPVSLTGVTCKVLAHIISGPTSTDTEFSLGYNTASVYPSPVKTQLLTTVQDLPLTIRDDGHQTDIVSQDAGALTTIRW